MNHAIKLGRLSYPQTSTVFSSSSSPLAAKRTAGSVRLLQASSNTDSKQPSSTKLDNMEKAIKDPQQTLNVMEESFGEGYATRSDEEGFGGIYGGNDECNVEAKVIQDPASHDNTQGSEVKEKEKARNQTHVQ